MTTPRSQAEVASARLIPLPEAESVDRETPSSVLSNFGAPSPARTRWLGVASITMVSLLAQLWGIERDLPMPTLDERYFVTPATYIASSGSLNPHWFGHPGSTIIYPLAALFRLREILFHGAPVLGAAHSVAARFQGDPASFYLTGRIWVMLLGLACLPLIYLIGRRTVGEVAAFAAAGIWAIAPLAVQYGTVTRTDTAGLFFALLTILWCMRALDRPSVGRFALTGVAAGFAVSSRYFLATLALVILLTWCMARVRSHIRFAALLAAAGAMVTTSVLTTPYFLLDTKDAIASLSDETTFRIPFQAHGILDNLTFYVGNAIPGAISWIGCAAAIVGMLFALRRCTPPRALLLLWVPIVVIESCFLGVHWNRWIIPSLPILLLLAAFGVVESARAITGSRAATRRPTVDVRRGDRRRDGGGRGGAGGVDDRARTRHITSVDTGARGALDRATRSRRLSDRGRDPRPRPHDVAVPRHRSLLTP